MVSSVSAYLPFVFACATALVASCAGAGAAREAAPDRAQESPAPAARVDLARDADARHAAALEAAHLDGLDEKVQALASLDDILAQSFRGAFLRDLDAPARGLPPAARARLDQITRVTREAYASDSLRAGLAARLADRPGAAHLEEIRAFLRGASWGRLAEARAYIRTRPGQKALAAFLGQVAARPPDEARLARVKELLRASRDVELMSALSFVATRAALEAVEQTLPRELSGGFDRWLESQPASADAFTQEIQRTLLLQDYFAFSALEERQLDDVLAFWRSDAGRWWAHARVDETTDLVQQRALRMKAALADVRERAP